MELPDSARAGNRHSTVDDTWSKLAMEGDLLWRGTGTGLKQGWDKIANDPKQAAIEAGLVASGSFALSIACQLGGAKVTKATQYILGAALVYDLGSRAINTIAAMSDVWHNPEHAPAAKAAFAANIGEGVFDYTANGLVSAGAFKLASGKVKATRQLFKEAKRDAMLLASRTNDTVAVRTSNTIVENQALPADSALRQVWSNNKDAVVRITGQAPDGPYGATGFFVKEDGLLATNCHVVSGLKNPTISTTDGRTFATRLVARDKYNDLALLRVTDAPEGTTFPKVSLDTTGGANHPVALISYPVEFDAMVIAPGNAGGRSGWKRTMARSPFVDLRPQAETYISSRHKPHVDYKVPPPEQDAPHYIRREVVWHNAPASPGTSGGPMFNVNGQAVAINTHAEIAVHAKHLDAMIKQVQLTPPGEGWLNIRSHAEPMGWFDTSTTPAHVIHAKVRNRWSLAELTRASMDADALAKSRINYRNFILKRLNFIGGVDATASVLTQQQQQQQQQQQGK